jgi:hypothetical protein
MVDMKKYFNDVDSKLDSLPYGNKSTKPLVSWFRPDQNWVTDCPCSVCEQRKEVAKRKKKTYIFGEYHGITPEEKKELDPHRYFLLPRKLWAFVFKTRTWGTFGFLRISIDNAND